MRSNITQHKKMKFSITDFFSKCDQIRSFLWIWSHLLKKSLMEWVVETGGRGGTFSGAKLFVHKIKSNQTKWREQTKKATKNDIRRRACSQKKWCPSHKFFHVPFAVTNLFFLDSHENLIILLRATRKTHPRTFQSIWDNYVILAQNYYNFTSLSTWVGYTYMCLKMWLRLKTRFSTSFDITWYAEAVMYTKNLLFPHSIVCYVR